MGVFIKDSTKLWPKPPGQRHRVVPYLISSGDTTWIETEVRKFNHLVEEDIFIPRTSEPIYISFNLDSSGGNMCNIGCEKKAGQVLKSTRDEKTLFHEMGHCIGLGHENFHADWPRKDELLSRDKNNVHRIAYIQNKDKYNMYQDFDAKSIMLYSCDAFGFRDIRFRRNNTLSSGDKSLIKYLMMR